MAGVQLSLQAKELPFIESVFGRLEARLTDTTPLMQILAAYGEESTRSRFFDQRDPDGKPWKQSHRARVMGGSTLIDSGDLEMSITHEAGPREAIWGVSRVNKVADYAAAHQFGVTIVPKTAKALRFQLPGVGFLSVKKVVLPRRSYLGVNAADRAEMANRASDYIAEVLP
jgi:phage virion morphogenesis protein